MTFRKIILGLIIFTSLFFTCNKSSEYPFTLTGTIEGITEGKAILTNLSLGGIIPDTAIIRNGKFVFKGNIPEPMGYGLSIKGYRGGTGFYAENAQMHFLGHIDSMYHAKVWGGSLQDTHNDFREESKLIKEEKFGLTDSAFYKLHYGKDEKVKAEINKNIKLWWAATDEQRVNFIKQNPASYYSAILIYNNYASRMRDTSNIARAEELLDMLDPKLNDYCIVKDCRKAVELAKLSANSDKIIGGTEEVSYELDKTYNGKEFKNGLYLGVFSNDNICLLHKDKSVVIINPEGEKTGSFKVEMDSEPTSIAVDDADNIFVLGCSYVSQKVKIRGKTVDRMVPNGVECQIYSSDGTFQKQLKLAGLVSAMGTRVVKDRLFVADKEKARVSVYDTKTGEIDFSIKGLRSCCGILDICVTPENEVLVASLGAFRVEGYDLNGKYTLAFGKRGPGLNEFHGCCNPVSVGYLSSGAIVTVEKDPTRIKVYSNNKARLVEGIEELVTGCKHIPLIVDSKDNLYLASFKKGLIKCIQKNNDL